MTAIRANGPEQQKHFEEIQGFFSRDIPFNQTLGMRLDEIGEGTCRVSIPFRKDLIGDPWRPALHGGVIAALIDVAGGLAGFASLRPGDRLSTIDMRVDYLRPAALEDLVADARVVRTGNRVCACDILVWQHRPDELIATGKAVYNIKRADD